MRGSCIQNFNMLYIYLKYYFRFNISDDTSVIYIIYNILDLNMYN